MRTCIGAGRIRGLGALRSGLAMVALVVATANAEPFFEHIEIAPGQEGGQAYTCLEMLPDGTLITPYALNNQSIWVVKSTDHGRTWGAPEKVFTNPPGGYSCDPNMFVLGQTVGVLPTRVPPPYPPYVRTETWGAFSSDGAKTWGEPELLSTPHKYLVGTIHRMIVLDDGRLLMPASYEVNAEKGEAPSNEGTMLIASGVLVSADEGRTWVDQGPFVTGKPPHRGGTDGMDEPAIVRLPNGELFMVARTGDIHPWEARSNDDGKTWSEPLASPLMGNNAPTAMATLDNGWVVRVWDNALSGRAPLCVTLSKDNGHTWCRPRNITTGYGAYPSVIQAADGTIVATYNAPVAGRKERLRVHVARFNTEWVLEAQKLPAVAFVGGSMTIGTRRTVPASSTFVPRLVAMSRQQALPVIGENHGVPSDTTVGARERIDAVLAGGPSIVVLEYGHCDSWMVDGKARSSPRVPIELFESNLRALVAKVRKAGATPVLMTGNRVTRQGVTYEFANWYDDHEPNEMLDKYYDLVRKVAADTQTPLADVAKAWEALDKPEEYMSDGQHASVKGQDIYLRVLSEALLPLLNR